jgi:hypothetical protein
MEKAPFAFARRLGALAALAILPACMAEVETRPPVVQGYATYYATTLPSDIYSQPYVVYNGHPTYWAEGHWYFETPRGWVTFREEPPYLYRQRTFVQQAPPAPRTSPYAYPPPATRVR